MAVTITDKITYKRLVAAGNDGLYFEDNDLLWISGVLEYKLVRLNSQ